MNRIIKYLFLFLTTGLWTGPAMGQDSIIFHEDFDVPHDIWMDSTGTYHQAGIKNGVYVMSNSSRKEALGSYIVVKFNEEQDYSIHCKLGKKSGYDYNGYGLVWGREDEENFYYFAISGGGKYKVLRTKRGRIKTLVNWTYADEINRRNATNTIELRRKGEKLLFYINDFKVEELEHPDFFGYELGFRVDDYMSINVYELTVAYQETAE